MSSGSPVNNDLRIVKELVYDKCGLEINNLIIGPESTEYGACSFELHGFKVQHRLSKITPKKSGQFVTIWKRNNKGITEPYDILDDIDFIIITSKSEDNLGQFIFPKSVLVEKGIISKNGKNGKRGIRVYPPWDMGISLQAQITQKWQLKYFVLIKKDTSIDLKWIMEEFTKTHEEKSKTFGVNFNSI